MAFREGFLGQVTFSLKAKSEWELARPKSKTRRFLLCRSSVNLLSKLHRTLDSL